MTAPRTRIPRCPDCANAKRTLAWRHRTLPAITERKPRRQSHYTRPDGTPICDRDPADMTVEAL